MNFPIFRSMRLSFHALRMSYRERGRRSFDQGYGGGRHGGGGHGRGGRKYQDYDSADNADNGPHRHPPGLKGKEIGLWYSRRSRAKKEMQDKQQRPMIKMDSRQENNIRDILDQFGSGPSSSSHPHQYHPSSHHTTDIRDCRDNDRTQKASSDDWFNMDSAHEETKPNSSSKSLESPVWHTSSPRIKENAYNKDGDNDEGEVGHDDNDNVEMSSQLAERSNSCDILASVTEVMKFYKEETDYGIDPASDDFVPSSSIKCNPSLDAAYQKDLQERSKSTSYQKMLQFRKKLPSYDMRKELVDKIQNNQVVVISGETGCGKTTQVPQFILDDYLEQGMGSTCSIICTQPRRISAVSVAQRVADERDVACGQGSEVGFQIRLERELPRERGSILFCTTGIVLKWLESDPSLLRASHIILDEIHERDLLSDFLMVIIKDLLVTRPDIKVILMSATLNAEMFSIYFGGAPMINIPGFTYPVKEYYLEDVLEMTNYQPPEAKRPKWGMRGMANARKEETERQQMKDWIRETIQGSYSPATCHSLASMDHKFIDIELVAELIKYICYKKEDGAILVFLTGWEEIRKTNDLLNKDPTFNSRNFRIIPLHSLMPTVNQREVFNRPPVGVRKIVLATNIAETSITIDDVVYVIDCGKIKVKHFEPEKNLTSLEPQLVSKANAKQRRGRAGRVQPGECYHLYSSFTETTLDDYLLPEMLRTRLEELCLQIKLLKLGKIIPFVEKAIQTPSLQALNSAIKILQDLNALDQDENLLPLGKHLARMPVDPHSGKMILFGAMFCCLDPILTVAASLSFKDAFVIPLGKEKAADQQRKMLAEGSKSDHIMLINAYKGWRKSVAGRYDYSYCHQNFLSSNTLKLLKEMKGQFASLIHQLGFISQPNPSERNANKNSDNLELIKAIICAGLYPNVAKVQKPSMGKRPTILQTKIEKRVSLHPKSVNSTESVFESKWLIYHQMLKTSGIYLHDCTIISPYPLLFFGGPIGIKRDGDQDCITVDEWIVFQASPKTAALVKDLRTELDQLLEEKISTPGPTDWGVSKKEGALMKAIIDLVIQPCPSPQF
ncbi:ATP-dependent DNA/RNA helicase DHX36 isoform X3 [Octopus sinensis]|uniref:RNA helicase n=1 Tax=Octopus sinensis TaxID=2607531 RepID=A0A7E6FQQ9_9MOLL|nr:ATP-dependent DNA/RNA helicase DHX36 isoform X3 [Octopus sinensis]